MENNDFQKDVNNIEENVKQVNENVQKKSKKGKTKTIILMVIVLVLVLVVGVLGGLLISGNENKVTNIINQGTEKKDENKSSKKIDESKPWVYDAEYCLKNKDKTAYGLNEGEEFNSSEYLKAPWVNINSDYGKKINTEIEELYDRLYNKFGTKSSSGFEQASELKYETFNSDKILSLVIIYREGVLNSGWSNNYIIYNINLDTLEEASYEEVYKECEFDNENDVKKYAEITLENLVDEDAGYEGTTINYSKYYMKNGKINFLIPNPAGILTPLEVKKGVERNNNLKRSYFEQNKNLNYTSNPKDNINGKVAIIKMGEKTFQTTTHDGYYTYTDNFGNSYSIKAITNITSEYRMTSNDGATNLFRAVIEYVDNNNAKKSFDTAVFVPNDANNYTTLSINGPYENYTGTTSFVRSFTDLYDDGKEKLPNGTSKIIKQLSPSGWAGSSMQEVRLYDNGDVYHIVYNGDGNTDENISSFKLIARNADTIEEKMNGQEFESIIVKGKYLTKVTDDGQLWILFENN